MLEQISGNDVHCSAQRYDVPFSAELGDLLNCMHAIIALV